MSRRVERYGKLVRGWDWRTTPERLELAEATRKKLGVSRTHFLELLIDRSVIGHEETMKHHKVTLRWSPSPLDRRPNPLGGSQAQVVVANSAAEAELIVLSGYDFDGSARRPVEIITTETDEPVGLQPYEEDE